MKEVRELFLKSKTGDNKAFEELIDRFKPLLKNVSMRSGRFDEDCYQECLIAFFQSINRFEFRN